jgi:hypothetical protein
LIHQFDDAELSNPTTVQNEHRGFHRVHASVPWTCARTSRSSEREVPSTQQSKKAASAKVCGSHEGGSPPCVPTGGTGSSTREVGVIAAPVRGSPMAVAETDRTGAAGTSRNWISTNNIARNHESRRSRPRRLPYGDRSGSKLRPAVVVQGDILNGIIDDTILVQITGTRHGLPGTEVMIDPANEPTSWLLKVCSVLGTCRRSATALRPS